MTKHHLCWSVLILALIAVPGDALGHRRLLHDGVDHGAEEQESATVESFLDQLQMQGITPVQRLNQVLGVEGLNEEGVNTLLQDIQG